MLRQFLFLIGFARKVQKSLSDLEKLHLAGQGINLVLPTGVGHKHEDRVWTFNNKRFLYNLKCENSDTIYHYFRY